MLSSTLVQLSSMVSRLQRVLGARRWPLLCAVFIIGLCGATGPRTRGNATREYLLSLTGSARPTDADPAFDCALLAARAPI